MIHRDQRYFLTAEVLNVCRIFHDRSFGVTESPGARRLWIDETDVIGFAVLERALFL